ncbi:MAG: hypothetical protein OIF47_17445 [Marinibacterium sp.]|nr:hypothetical protein [Marinibacterium sp.]
MPHVMTAAFWTVFLCGVAVSWGGWPWALALGGAAALVVLASRLRNPDASLRGLMVMAIGCVVLAQGLGVLSPKLMVQAVTSGLSLGAFMLSLQVLSPAVDRSDLVERVGRVFVRQPPGRRYYAISVGVNLMGLLLSISVIPLFLTMVRRTLDDSAVPLSPQARQTIRRRSASAIQRGVSMVPLWSPVSLVIVVLSGMFPDMAWHDYLPFGAGLSVTLVLIGRWVDRIQNPGTVGLAGFSTRPEPKPLLALLAIMALVPAIAWAVGEILQGPRLLGLLLAFPVVGVVFFAAQSLSIGRSPLSPGEVSGFLRALSARFQASTRELSVFLIIGFVSTLAVPIFRQLHLGDVLVALPVAPELVLFGCVIAALGLSVLGISPLITATLIVDLFIQPQTAQVHHALLILSAAFLVGHSWLVSPVSYGAMSVSRDLGVPVREILIRWNLPYVICALAVYGVMTASFAWLS